MLINRHRDRGQAEPGAVPESGMPTPGSKPALQAQAAMLGLSTRGSKADLQERIDAAKAKAAESGKQPSDNDAPDGQPPAPSKGGEGGDHPEDADDAEAPSYADLDDDQLLEAYSLTIPDGEAEDRDAMLAELQELAEGDEPIEEAPTGD